VSIHAYGSHLAPSAAGAAAVADLLGVSAEEIARGLASYRTIAGRANVIRTESLTIIDDCYNANPNSVAASLRSLAELTGRRVAILGDMNELGRGSNELHRNIGILAGNLGIDVLICCGERAEFIFKGFIASKSENKAYHFPFRDALFERLPSLIKKGDAILVKASHSMQFDEIVTRVRSLLP
jgi:UDP-N-acetylmuramoyl-tripeptide--D-alanyl-D-alanine ligase